VRGSAGEDDLAPDFDTMFSGKIEQPILVIHGARCIRNVGK
jgi:hypothetical protein